MQQKLKIHFFFSVDPKPIASHLPTWSKLSDAICIYRGFNQAEQRSAGMHHSPVSKKLREFSKS